MILVDTHCHLETFADIDSVLNQAKTCSVEHVVAVSQDPSSMRSVLDIGIERPNSVWVGLGLHPAWVLHNENSLDSALDWMERHSSRADVIGEIGGEQTIGRGQVLTGAPGAKTTEGIRVSYTGETAPPGGFAGTLTFSQNSLTSLSTRLSNKL